MIRIGTSGWTYEDWKRRFYPETLKKDQWLSFYSQHFDTVEINGTFYRLPSREVFEKWANQTSPDFLFSVKASRYLTHLKRLIEPEEPIQRFYQSAEGLGDKLGPVLFQLPPHFPANPERLDYFLSKLPAERRVVFEFRDPSWFTEPIYKLLKSYSAALCFADAPNFPSEEIITAPFIYIRLHGHTQLYASEYTEEELIHWNQKIESWASDGYDVYLYFDNDAAARAVRNAETIRKLLRIPA